MTRKINSGKKFQKRIVIIRTNAQNNYKPISTTRRRVMEKSIEIISNSIKRTI
jgi:hypothetical protein